MADTNLGPAVSIAQANCNTVLQAMGCRAIGVDGALGPQTCGAIQHVLANAPASLQSSAAYTIVQAHAWLLDSCTSAPSYSCSATAAPPSPTTTPLPAAEPLPMQSAGMSTADMIMWGTALAAVAVVGYAVAKKKGWIQ